MSSISIKKLPVSLFVFLILIFSVVCQAQWISAGNVENIEKNESSVLFQCDNSLVRMDILTDKIIRITLFKNKKEESIHSWAVIFERKENVGFEAENNRDYYIIKTKDLKVKADKKPFRLSFYNSSEKLINKDDSKGICWDKDRTICYKALPENENYYGFGEKTGKFNKRGTVMEMWNTDFPGYGPPWHTNFDPLYKSIPFFIGINETYSYGIFLDNHYRTVFDMGKMYKDIYSFSADGGVFDYYFIYGPTPEEVTEQYMELTGKIPLPPKWSIGYQQCRYSYYPESQVRDIAYKFRDKKIPCDVLYLDIHYMDAYKCFTWDQTRFPEPEKLLSGLKKDGFKVVTIIDPGIKKEKGYYVYDSGVKGDHFCKLPDGKYFEGIVWPGNCVFPDFTRENTRKWWGGLYKNMLDIGVAGFWNDMNEPAVFNTAAHTFPDNVIFYDNGSYTDHNKNHNIYGMQMARGTYEGLLNLKPDTRPFVLSRAGYSGIQRYACQWTGDNISNWEHLKLSVTMCLNMSLSGLQFVGPDIGGFINSPDGELFTRWLQVGVFLPFFRTHTAIGTKNQEPWSYGSSYEQINRKYIELRYELMPYLYNTFREASETGTPIIRPLFYCLENDENAYSIDEQFLFGNDIMIAPVLKKGEFRRDVYFGNQEWYDFWTGKPVEKILRKVVYAPVEHLPVYVKKGAIIPAREPVQYIGEKPADPLILKIYPGREGALKLYEDDGSTFAYKKGKFSMTGFHYTFEKKFLLNIDPDIKNFKPVRNSYEIILYNQDKEPRKVRFNDRELNNSFLRKNLKMSSYYYDEKGNFAIIKIPFTGEKSTLQIEF